MEPKLVYATYKVEIADTYDLKIELPISCARTSTFRTPVVGDLKKEMLKHLYNGANYYVYNALESNELDLLQIMYTGATMDILADNFELSYSRRTLEGITQIAAQLIDYNTSQVVLQAPWPTPSTKVATIGPKEWIDIYGKECDPDTDWDEDEDLEGYFTQNIEDGTSERKRLRSD